MKLTLLAVATLSFAAASFVHARDAAGDQGVRPDPGKSDAWGEGITAPTFLTKAAMSGMAEVELGKLAAAQGGSADVREYGQQMVADHSKANSELMAVAADENVRLPPALDAEHQAIHDRLRALSGDGFDRAYAEVMVDSHVKAVALFEAGADLDDDGVSEFAEAKLPTLRQHRSHAERLRGGQ